MEDFTQIFYNYKDKVYNQAFRMLGSYEDTEEAVQEIFLKIYRGLSEFRGDAQLSTWIFRIASNVCMNRWKQKKGKLNSIEDESIQFEVTREYYIPAPDIQYERIEFRNQVLNAIAKLPPEYSAIITLFYFENLSYEEISNCVNIPIGTVGTYLHRAKNMLRILLKREFQEMVLV